jgi:hypothetical protein
VTVGAVHETDVPLLFVTVNLYVVVLVGTTTVEVPETVPTPLSIDIVCALVAVQLSVVGEPAVIEVALATKFEQVGSGTAWDASFVLHVVVAPSALYAVRVKMVVKGGVPDGATSTQPDGGKNDPMLVIDTRDALVVAQVMRDIEP